MTAPQAVAVVVLGCLTGLAGLPSPAAAQQWTMPRTEYGHPDIQGRWSNAFVTPLQRPEGQAQALTWEQVAQFERAPSAVSHPASSRSIPTVPLRRHRTIRAPTIASTESRATGSQSSTANPDRRSSRARQTGGCRN